MQHNRNPAQRLHGISFHFYEFRKRKKSRNKPRAAVAGVEGWVESPTPGGHVRALLGGGAGLAPDPERGGAYECLRLPKLTQLSRQS